MKAPTLTTLAGVALCGAAVIGIYRGKESARRTEIEVARLESALADARAATQRLEGEVTRAESAQTLTPTAEALGMAPLTADREWDEDALRARLQRQKAVADPGAPGA